MKAILVFLITTFFLVQTCNSQTRNPCGQINPFYLHQEISKNIDGSNFSSFEINLVVLKNNVNKYLMAIQDSILLIRDENEFQLITLSGVTLRNFDVNSSFILFSKSNLNEYMKFDNGTVDWSGRISKDLALLEANNLFPIALTSRYLYLEKSTEEVFVDIYRVDLSNGQFMIEQVTRNEKIFNETFDVSFDDSLFAYNYWEGHQTKYRIIDNKKGKELELDYDGFQMAKLQINCDNSVLVLIDGNVNNVVNISDLDD